MRFARPSSALARPSGLSPVRLVRAVAALGLVVAGCGGGAGAPAPSKSASASASTSTVASTTSSSTAPAGEAVLLGEVSDPAMAETSGLVASRRNPGLMWAHNDSGDEPRLYCLTRQAARCGTWEVTGAEAVDWEDMAAGPGPEAGRSYLYVGDIGDNRRVRNGVVVYRFPEPLATAYDGKGPATGLVDTEPAVALRLRYDDGAHDAEALLVHPVTGDLYVVIKDPRRTTVYKASNGSDILSPIAGLKIGLAEFVTGADISPDGRRVVLCTYRQGFELDLADDSSKFDDIWARPPTRFDLGGRAQGEAIAYRLDGKAVVTASERSPFPLHEVTRRP